MKVPSCGTKIMINNFSYNKIIIKRYNPFEHKISVCYQEWCKYITTSIVVLLMFAMLFMSETSFLRKDLITLEEECLSITRKNDIKELKEL